MDTDLGSPTRHRTRIRAAVAACVVLSVLPAGAKAGQVFGTISERGKPVAGEMVSISCDAGTADSQPTDEFGAYRVFVASEGPCLLTVRGLDGARIRAYGSAQRYNFEIRSVGGRSVLERR